MATLLFKFVFLDNASPAVVLTSTELTAGDAPTVNISTTALADGTVASDVSGGALTYDTYTKSWSYRLASADLATYLYVGMATTTYATASPASVHALGMVVPDVLPSTLATAAALATVDSNVDAILVDTGTTLPATLGTPAGVSLAADIAAVKVDTAATLVDTGTTLPATLGTPAGADMSADIAAVKSDTAAILIDTAVLETAMADSIPADGTIPSPVQALYMIVQFLNERSTSGTTYTIKKVDGATTLYTLTTNDATTPTSVTRG